MKINWKTIRYSLGMFCVFGTSAAIALYCIVIGSRYLATLTRELNQWLTLS